jgi:hypothetical protein
MEVGQDLAHDGTGRDRGDHLAPAATNGALFDVDGECRAQGL